MNRTWLASLILVTGIYFDALGGQYVFQAVPTSVVDSFNPSRMAYYGVATSGTNYFCVGSGSIASMAGIGANLSAGGYLLDNSVWKAKNVSAGGYKLNAVTYGENVFLAVGSANTTFTSSGGNLGNPSRVLSASTVDAQGVAYNSVSRTFALITASFQAAWAPSNLASWNNAYDFKVAVLESFRGVTAMGGSSFALCGMRGVIRISSDGGRSWNINQAFDFNQPDLNSIASDGAQSLVCVGSAGMVKLSLDGGANWTTVNIANFAGATSTTVFYGAAYTGTHDNQFVVIGNGGNAYIANNTNNVNWNWSPVTLQGGFPANNLNGATFASSGPLRGTAMLVGDAGTILVGGTIPQPPINLVNQTNCASFPNPSSNPALSANTVTDWYHPAGSLVVDWFSVRDTNNPVATGTSSFVPTDSAPLDFNTPSNYVYLVRARDIRTGLTSLFANVTLTINPRPTAVLVSFNTTDCNEGRGYTLTNNLTGIGPWAVTWSDGVTQTSTGRNLLRTVFPTNSFGANMPSNNVYWVTNIVDVTGCVGDQTNDITGVVTITINPRPTAALMSFNTTNCNEGRGYILTNTLTGIGPWVVTWNDGLTQTNATNILVRTVFPTNSFGANTPSNNVYRVTNIVDVTGCVGDQANDITGVVTITINPSPTAVLVSFNTTDCNDGPVYTLTNNLTGIGPWEVTWNDGVTQTNATNILVRTVFPTNSFGANTPSNNVYRVTGIVDVTGCVGDQANDLTGVVTITINPRPTASLVTTQTICNGTGVKLTAKLTGLGPWTVVWSDGGEQVTNAPVGSGAVAERWVQVTNALPNTTNINIFTVLSVTNSDMCLGNQPGDLTCTNFVTVELCTNPPTINFDGTNGIIQWYGNLGLESTTNLPTTNWTPVAMGTNTWSWTNKIPPIQFFRLYAPTN